ncbi:MAG: type III-A CRISPR-associated RAMP protein Csm5 [Bacteroidia bacterium]
MSQNVIYLKVETLTPLHIGSGRELQGNFEYLYFQKEKKIALIEEEKVLAIIGRENVEQWLGIIERKNSLLELLRRRKNNLQPADVARRIMDIPHDGPLNDNTIREQMVDGMGRPVLPGSSFKGSVRTVVVNDLLEKSPGLAKDHQLLGKRQTNGKSAFGDRGFQNQLIAPNLRKDIPNHDIFRLFRPGDVFFSRTEVFRVSTFNKKMEGWKDEHEISPWLECIPAGQTSRMRLTRPEDTLLQFLGNHYEGNFDFPQNPMLTEWEKLAPAINQHTLRLLEEEIAFWKKEGKPAIAGAYMAKLESLKQQITALPEGACLIRVGYGGGVNAMTGGWQKRLMAEQDYRDWMKSFRGAAPHLAFPKTRKVTPRSQPLGYLLLTPMNEAEVAAWDQNEQKQKNVSRAIPATGATPSPKADPPSPPEPVKPQYPPAGTKIRVGTTLDAFVYTSSTGKQKKIGLYVGKGQDIDLTLAYASDLILGKIILVEVTAIANGKVTAVKFKGLK